LSTIIKIVLNPKYSDGRGPNIVHACKYHVLHES